jgi:hypothetical protein
LGVRVERKLSEPQTCPACRSAVESLVVTVDPSLRTPFFRCTHCGVCGDALDLVTAMSDQPLSAAIARFDVAGDLHACIEGPSNPSQSYARYLRARDSAHGIVRYLRMGHARLMDREHSAAGVMDVLRAEGWVLGDGVSGVPESLGHYDPDDAPPALTVAYRPKKRENYLFAAYTYNGLLATLEIRPVSDLSNILHRAYKFSDRGVYNERALRADNGPVLLVAPDTFTATMLSTRYSAVFGTELPVICPLGLPLPQTAHHIRRVVLLDMADNPLALGRMVPWLQASLWARQQHAVAVQVAQLPQASAVSVGELDSMLSEPDRWTDLRQHLTATVHDRYARTGTYALRKELTEEPLSDDAAAALMQLLEEADLPEELLSALRNIQEQCTASINLASGAQVLSTPSGFVGIRASGDRVQLSNTTFTPLCVSVGDDRELYYRCRVACENVSAVVERWFPAAVFDSADALQRAIATELAVSGIKAYVTFYGVRDFRFSEILGAMARGLTPRPAIRRMGVASPDTVWLPQFIIQGGSRADNRRIHAELPDFVSSAYGALDRGDDLLDDTFPELWRTTDVGQGAYLLGICHVLYCVLIAQNRAVARQPRQPHHLVYADLDPQLWQGTVSALWHTFALSAGLPQLTTGNISRELEAYAALGDLPYIGQLACPQARQAAPYGAAVPTILVAGSAIATTFGVMDRVSYVCLPPTDTVLPCAPDDGLCARVRAQFPALLEHLLDPRLDLKVGNLLSFPVPCVALYRALGAIMGWPCSDTVAELGAAMCQAGTENTVAVFLRHLRELLDRRPLLLAEADPAGNKAAAVCLHDGAAYIRKRATTWLNAEFPGLNFQHKALTYMLAAGRLLVEDTQQHWMISRRDWDTYTSTEPARSLAQ